MSRRAVKTGDSAVVEGVTITHPERVLDPERGLMKLEFARYYGRVSTRVLPHLADRPLALVRCPEGTAKPCFCQKQKMSASAGTDFRCLTRYSSKAG